MIHPHPHLARCLLALCLSAASLAAVAAPAGSSGAQPADQGASRPRSAPAKDGAEGAASWDRPEPRVIERGASYPGARRRVFPAE